MAMFFAPLSKQQSWPNFFCYTICLLFLLLAAAGSFDMAAAAIKVRRHFNEYSVKQLEGSHNSANNNKNNSQQQKDVFSSPAQKLLEAYRQRLLMNNKEQTEQQKQQQQESLRQKAVDAHCWIKIERKSGEVFEENGSCTRLSPGIYACQSKTFVDPFNPYCIFMD